MRKRQDWEVAQTKPNTDKASNRWKKMVTKITKRWYYVGWKKTVREQWLEAIMIPLGEEEESKRHLNRSVEKNSSCLDDILAHFSAMANMHSRNRRNFENNSALWVANRLPLFFIPLVAFCLLSHPPHSPTLSPPPPPAVDWRIDEKLAVLDLVSSIRLSLKTWD